MMWEADPSGLIAVAPLNASLISCLSIRRAEFSSSGVLSGGIVKLYPSVEIDIRATLLFAVKYAVNTEALVAAERNVTA